MDFVFAYITAESKEQALSIGKILVEERLAACVNVFDGITSIYEWDGKINADDEAVLIAKTAKEKFQSLVERVQKLHSYDCPCIVEIPITDGSSQYLGWLNQRIFP